MAKPKLPAFATCTYCGDPAYGWDHVIPVSRSRHIRNASRFGPDDWRVPACMDCNSSLCDRPFFDVPSRAGYVLSRVKVRFAKLLKTPDWDDEELMEMGSNLRASILDTQREKARVELRIAHLRVVAAKDQDYLRPTDFKEPV